MRLIWQIPEKHKRIFWVQQIQSVFLVSEFPWAKTTSNPYLPPDLHPEPCRRRCRPDGVTTFHLIHRGLDSLDRVHSSGR